MQKDRRGMTAVTMSVYARRDHREHTGATTGEKCILLIIFFFFFFFADI